MRFGWGFTVVLRGLGAFDTSNTNWTCFGLKQR